MAFDPRAMSLRSLFQSKESLAAKRAQAHEPWRRSDFVSYSMGGHSQVVHTRAGSGIPKVFPGFVIDFVHGCEEFAPMAMHLGAHADKYALNSSQLEALQAWLPEIIEAGALVSGKSVRAWCAASGQKEGAAPALGLIGFPTGGPRVAILERAIRSFSKNARDHGRPVDFLVADSSHDPAHREAFRSSMAGLRKEHGGGSIVYAGEEEKRRFAAQLIRESGCRPESVEFALFDPFGTGFACGANRNLLLLHGAGRAFCSVDDDVVCRLAAPPEAGASALSLFSTCDPFSRWLFDSPRSAMETAAWTDTDFLGLHEQLLGRDMAALGGGSLGLAQAGDEVLRRLEAGPARVRATFTGHIGDPGIPTSVYYLFFKGENRRRLTADAAHYEAVFGSRSVLSVAENLSVGDASVSPGMAMGLDHRELLPPFFPVLHAEDFIFGATLWQCCPGALLGHLPLAIEHSPPVGKPILMPGALDATNRAVVFEFAHLLRRLILGFHPAEEAGAADRIMALGRYLSEFAAVPERDFIEALRRQVLEHESAKVCFLEEELNADMESPECWRRDVEAYLAHVREAMQHEDFDIPFDLKARHSSAGARRLMQGLIGRFGGLLQDWPAMVAAGERMKFEG